MDFSSNFKETSNFLTGYIEFCGDASQLGDKRPYLSLVQAALAGDSKEIHRLAEAGDPKALRKLKNFEVSFHKLYFPF